MQPYLYRMKKKLGTIIFALFLVGLFFLWKLFGSVTSFSDDTLTFYIKEENISKEKLIAKLKENKVISNSFVFELLGDQLTIWERIKPGKYKVNKGESVVDIIRMFRNNTQVNVNLVINKIRLPEDLARLIGRSFMADSAEAISKLTNAEMLHLFNADSNSFLFNIIPNTYTFYWSTPVEKIFEKISVKAKEFWDLNNRKEKAFKLSLTLLQVYTIASIVEEETNKDDEKGNVASVYINRMKIGMALGADPTIKFALKDFSIKRILFGHLKVQSPYNTYKNKGLPPGPICTPSIKTIDAVLNTTPTDYLFFVAKSDFSGYHHFSKTFAEHDKFAKQYQKALTIYNLKKQNKN